MSSDERNQSPEWSPWNERLLIAAIVATMLLSLLGYMHG
jgi:hypothetical protein